MIKAKEKKERSLGVKLFLKAERCNSPKCAMTRRNSRPGQHGKARRRAPSEYGQQLAEKQKIMFSYGLKEGHMRRIVQNAATQKDVAVTQSIVQLLERRLDNVVFRLGFAPSRIVARQIVSHGHIMLNGKKARTPSIQVKPKDIISIRPESQKTLIFKDLSDKLKQYETPTWLSLDKDKLAGTVKTMPTDVEMLFDINLVVDFYSK